MASSKEPHTPESETPFGFLYACADETVRAEFAAWVKSDPERLLMMLKRSVNPVLHLDNKQEGRLRGDGKPVNRKTIGKKKRTGEMPFEPHP